MCKGFSLKKGAGFLGIIFLMTSLLIFAWIFLHVAEVVNRPLSPDESGKTILDDARDAKNFLEKRNELLQP